MKYARLNESVYLARLDLGDNVHDSLLRFCQVEAIGNASVQGIGSLEHLRIAHYTLATRRFATTRVRGPVEVSSLLGNIGLVDDQPHAHLHVTIAGPDLTARAGHLVEGACAATFELFIATFTSAYMKTPDSVTGLHLWELPNDVS